MMQISAATTATSLSPMTSILLERMHCPLTGLAQAIGFARRGIVEPRVAVAGGDMTGVHVLAQRPPPREGAYHIGGSGITYEEVIIRTLGETLERYAQFIPAQLDGRRIRSATPDELVAAGEPTVATDGWRFFTSEQVQRPGFPFAQLSPQQPIGWVQARSVPDGEPCWAPAQQALVGYQRHRDEPAYMPGVTTGTAAHTRLEDAVLNALLELIQIDAAVGHWYGSGQAVAIAPDARTRILDALIGDRLRPGGPSVRFYRLPSADLPGFAIACVLASAHVPRLAVGLGSAMGLTRAMYRAFLEAAAVAQLAKVILFRQMTMGLVPGSAEPDRIYDLDSNVGYYAAGSDGAAVADRFAGDDPVAASDLDDDAPGDAAAHVALLIEAIRATDKRLVFLDLTTSDVAQLGFCVVRLWSPDLLSLPLPSAPPLEHPRFLAYGGTAHDAPHPYP
jgi:thiazole/oxazole-forming peptide maturase SagD family component